MPYDVRITGRAPVRFDTQAAAVEYALAHADENPEMFDTEPGASDAGREALARKIGS